MTTPERDVAAIRERHFPDQHSVGSSGYVMCAICPQTWPCDVAVLLSSPVPGLLREAASEAVRALESAASNRFLDDHIGTVALQGYADRLRAALSAAPEPDLSSPDPVAGEPGPAAFDIEEGDQPARLAAFLCRDAQEYSYDHGPHPTMVGFDTPWPACPRHQAIAANLFAGLRSSPVEPPPGLDGLDVGYLALAIDRVLGVRSGAGDKAGAIATEYARLLPTQASDSKETTT